MFSILAAKLLVLLFPVLLLTFSAAPALDQALADSQTGIAERALLDKSATADNLKQLLERRDLVSDIVSRERLDHLFHMTREDADLLLKANPQLFSRGFFLRLL